MKYATSLDVFQWPVAGDPNEWRRRDQPMAKQQSCIGDLE